MKVDAALEILQASLADLSPFGKLCLCEAGLSAETLEHAAKTRGYRRLDDVRFLSV
jgi:hypothetical protein